MKKCGCGKGHDHGKCPAAPACDTAKSHAHFCDAGIPVGGTEETVVLGDVPVQVLTESDICLPSYATDVKVIRKNIYLTQCKAIPVDLDPTNGDPTTTSVKLFVEGYIHKNIQYVEDCEGYVKDYSVNVPFKCYSRVDDLAVPAILPLFSSKASDAREIRETDKDGMGANRCFFGSNTFEFLNEPIKCRLISWNLTEGNYLSNFDKWGRFDKITEKDDINLVLRLTQRQFTPGTTNGGDLF
ncbi:CsxC family protein [Cytobacillus sp. FSL H8-0458]|uniref:CsxC family protein n=1 Tax=Cytobacillus sp. FSL H8-0458 TaxID=2975346 RepID=UPI0030F67440